MYLIYSEKMDAIDRATAEGKAQDLSFWKHGHGSKYLSLPRPTEPTDSKPSQWALGVKSYNLTEEEQSAVVQDVVFWKGDEE